MDPRFHIHNSHRESVADFARLDPQLRRLATLKYVYESPLIRELPRKTPGIYTIGGGRQVGKSTLVKQWMASLLKEDVLPKRIAFLTGELIDDHHSLIAILQEEVRGAPTEELFYLAIDEVTYIKEWDRAVKFAADAGLLDRTVLVLTGSDLLLIQEARMRFPGRRGRAETVDFHYYPLSFREVVELKGAPGDIASLFEQLDQYLLHGGYLLAINDLAASGVIETATLRTYSDWIRGDMLKRGKQERYLREVVEAIRRRQGSQASWSALARELSIDHHATVADYVELLERMDAVFVQSAIREDKLTAAPKKAKKISFADPFIQHSLGFWLHPAENYFFDEIVGLARDPARAGALVEAIVSNHCKRRYPTYYIKGKGEVDVAYVHNNAFWPIEVKWARQVRPKELKQLSKYENGQIWYRSNREQMIANIKARPLPQALFELG